MKKILLTGATGFVGANLIRMLVASGQHTVFIFARKTSDMWRLQGFDEAVERYNIDITDKESVRQGILKIRPDVVFHLAMFGAYSYQKDIETIVHTNILGSVALFEALRETDSAISIVNIGSTSEYGFKKHPMKETDLLEPNTPYGIAKAAQTFFACHYALAHNLPITTLRLTLVYGPYEESGRLIPDIMQAFIKKETLRLASRDSRRDFIYVEDVVSALQSAANQPQVPGSIFNVGSGIDYAVEDVVTRASAMAGIKVPLQWGSEDKKRTYNAAVNWIADISKAREELKWQPAHTLEEGLLKTYTWYDKNIHLYNR